MHIIEISSDYYESGSSYKYERLSIYDKPYKYVNRNTRKPVVYSSYWSNVQYKIFNIKAEDILLQCVHISKKNAKSLASLRLRNDFREPHPITIV